MPDSLVARFAARVAAAPDAPAVVAGDRTLSYAELDRWAGAVHAALHRAGAAPGGLVGLSLRRGAPVVAGILGVLRAGCGYVALDPAYPPLRLAAIAEDTRLTTVLGDERTPDCFGPGVRTVELPPAGSSTAAGPAVPVGPDSPPHT